MTNDQECQGRRAAGFTLIELILVMTILTIAVSLTAPTLARFFHGRSLDSQVRGLLALTRHGQGRAISEGIPMDLWVDTTKSVFHLEADASYEQQDPKQVDFPLYDDVQVEFLNNGLATASETTSTTPAANNRPTGPRIHFQPDGSIGETSPTTVKLTGRDGLSLYLIQSTNRLSYEIPTRNK